jgi:hypothetical protein
VTRTDYHGKYATATIAAKTASRLRSTKAPTDRKHDMERIFPGRADVRQQQGANHRHRVVTARTLLECRKKGEIS